MPGREAKHPVKGTAFHDADIASTNSKCAWNGDM
jgi:hypothetical protein